MGPSGVLGGTQGVWDGAQLSTPYEASAIPTVLSLGPTNQFFETINICTNFLQKANTVFHWYEKNTTF